MKENKFMVDFGELKLTDDQRRKINSSIQKVASEELANIHGEDKTRNVLIPVNNWPHFPILWGLIIRDWDKVIIKDSVNVL